MTAITLLLTDSFYVNEHLVQGGTTVYDRAILLIPQAALEDGSVCVIEQPALSFVDTADLQ